LIDKAGWQMPLSVSTGRRSAGAMATGTTDVDQQCIRVALAGDAAAMRRLVDVLTPVVQARVARALFRRGNLAARDVRQDVADFTQEAFVALLANGGRALTSWDPAGGRSLQNYVGQRVEWFVASLLRGAPMLEYVVHDGAQKGACVLESRDSVRRVMAGIERRWPESGLRLFYLLFVLQAPSKEVGDELGLSSDAVDHWRFRLREFARGLLLEE
jgi:RNA polymerase sigma-70 factor, ECF subfamily